MNKYSILVPRLGPYNPETESGLVGFEVVANNPQEAMDKAKSLPEASKLSLLWEDASLEERRVRVTFTDEEVTIPEK